MLHCVYKVNKPWSQDPSELFVEWSSPGIGEMTERIAFRSATSADLCSLTAECRFQRFYSGATTAAFNRGDGCLD